jgi:hypothetical protein
VVWLRHGSTLKCRIGCVSESLNVTVRIRI